MDAKQKAASEKLINSTINETNEMIAILKERAKAVAPDVAIGRLSRMEAINDKSVAEANLHKAQNRVQSLKQALARLGEGTYGLCVQCEEAIPEKRLQLLPETTLCMDCLNTRK